MSRPGWRFWNRSLIVRHPLTGRTLWKFYLTLSWRRIGLSHDDVLRTHLGDNDLGGHHEEPDQAPHPELHHGDEEQRDEAPVSRLRSQERDEQGGRRVLPLDAVPLVRLAQRAEGDVEAARCLACEEGVSLVNLTADRDDLPDLWAHQYGGDPGTVATCPNNESAAPWLLISEATS